MEIKFGNLSPEEMRNKQKIRDFIKRCEKVLWKKYHIRSGGING